MHRTQRGFSLIELLIVIGIIGILAGLAMPAYRTYTARAKFSEVISATEPFKIAVAECLMREGGTDKCSTAGSNGLPPELKEASTTTSTTTDTPAVGETNPKTSTAPQYVATVKVGSNATITATAVKSNGLDGQTYVLTPDLSKTTGMVTWAVDCTAGGGDKLC